MPSSSLPYWKVPRHRARAAALKTLLCPIGTLCSPPPFGSIRCRPKGGRAQSTLKQASACCQTTIACQSSGPFGPLERCLANIAVHGPLALALPSKSQSPLYIAEQMSVSFLSSKPLRAGGDHCGRHFLRIRCSSLSELEPMKLTD